MKKALISTAVAMWLGVGFVLVAGVLTGCAHKKTPVTNCEDTATPEVKLCDIL